MQETENIREEEEGSHQCALVPYLVTALVILVCVSLLLFCLCLYLFIKYRRVSPRSLRNDSLSLALGDMCKINSFTFLELRKQNRCSQTVTPRQNATSDRNDNPGVFQKVKSKSDHPSSSSSGIFRRYEPELYKTVSRLSVGMSNSLSHSSYNSANEELEFDLYDYENENRVGEPEDTFTQRTWQGEDYSMSELAPAKLFPSDDTIINIEEDILDTKVSNTFGTPVVLRRGAYSRNKVESITSDLTSSIMSELSLNSHIRKDGVTGWGPERLNRNAVESLVMCYEDNRTDDRRDEDLNRNNQHDYNMIKQDNARNRNMEDVKFIDTDTALVDLNDNKPADTSPDSFTNDMTTKMFSEVPNNNTMDYSFPPITLIDDLELWDD